MTDSKKPNGVPRRSVASYALAGAIGAGMASSSLLARSEAPTQYQGDENERPRRSVLDFGADATGRNDSSAAFRAALADAKGGTVEVPTGTFLVGELGGLEAAGSRLVGASRWRSILKSEQGGEPIFSSRLRLEGTSAFHLISDLLIDLNGSPATAIDLGSVNATSIQRVHFRGGSRRPVAGSVGVRFDAPLRRGAYDNALYDCSFEFLDRAVVWETGANTNSAFNCRINNCNIGYDAAPSGRVDTPRIFGGRVEACNVGLREGAAQGSYFGMRFEASRIADIEFTERSLNAAFFGGHTASSAQVLRDIQLAQSPMVDGSDIGMLAIEESASRPKVSTGRHVFGKAGKAPAIPRGSEYAAYFADSILAENGIMPRAAGAGSLGNADREFRSIHVAEGLFVSGERVVAGRQQAIPDDRSKLANSDTVNDILAVLRAHGLIER